MNEISDKRLTVDEWEKNMKPLKYWTGTLDQIFWSVPKFDSHLAARRFFDRVWQAGANMNHDAEVTICYKKVDLILTTHHVGDWVTMRDITMAKKIEEIYEEVT